jgi:two-component system chemotaxis sensor kinase CheA
MEKDKAFLIKLRETFRVEAEDHLGKISAGLLELEKARSVEECSKIAETVYREAHSLKGAARAVDLGSMETICQSLEGIFGAVKRGKLVVTSEFFDVLHRTLDAAHGLLTTPANARATLPHGILEQLERFIAVPGSGAERAGCLDSPAPADFPEVPTMLSDTVRISTKKLLTLLLIAEGMLSVKLEADQRTAELTELLELAGQWRRGWDKVSTELRRGRTSSPERVLELVSDSQEQVTSLAEKLSATARAAEKARESSGEMWANLLEGSRSALLFPFSSLLEFIPRMIRDLSREQGKEAELVVKGEGIEVDRRILQELKDPMVHMMRNAVGHGIEKPDERTRKGKPRKGSITIEIAQKDGRTVELTVSDDGAGIDAAEVKSAAIRSGVIDRKQADGMSDREALELVFRSEVTTSRLVNGISGRGLGLAITLEKVKKLGGTMTVSSAPSTGTTFRIRVPVSLAGFRGVIVRVSDRLFVIPTSAVLRVLRIDGTGIRTLGNKELLSLGESVVPFVNLEVALEIAGASDRKGIAVQAVVLEADGMTAAFAVDEVQSEQEVLMRTLGRQLTRVRNISGATILGSGRVVPILNVSDLVKRAHAFTAPITRETEIERKAPAEKKSILVVEDSITSRMLLKNILESAGYRVKTAVDGVDAFTELKTAGYNLVVSDIDMPRMNGFELTAKIRSDAAVAETPVVLVTALDSREDRERGIDAGANAYIVKSSFDQGNLLEIVRRLL